MGFVTNITIHHILIDTSKWANGLVVSLPSQHSTLWILPPKTVPGISGSSPVGPYITKSTAPAINLEGRSISINYNILGPFPMFTKHSDKLDDIAD